MEDTASLDRAFSGAYGVYSVQNLMTSGLDGEVRQRRNVGEAAHRAGIRLLVQGSAGTGERVTRVTGRPPLRFPMPVRLFERFAPDTAALWRWARTARLDADSRETRGIVPDLLTVETWLERQFTDHRQRRVRM